MRSGTHLALAEGVGFEPTGPEEGPAVFKTAAFVRSAIPPGRIIAEEQTNLDLFPSAGRCLQQRSAVIHPPRLGDLRTQSSQLMCESLNRKADVILRALLHKSRSHCLLRHVVGVHDAGPALHHAPCLPALNAEQHHLA